MSLKLNLLADSDGLGFSDSLCFGPERGMWLVWACRWTIFILLLNRLGFGDDAGLGFGFVGCLGDDDGPWKMYG